MSDMIELWRFGLAIGLRPKGVIGFTVELCQPFPSAASGAVCKTIQFDQIVPPLENLHGDVLDVGRDFVYHVVGSGGRDFDNLVSGLGVPSFLLKDGQSNGNHEGA